MHCYAIAFRAIPYYYIHIISPYNLSIIYIKKKLTKKTKKHSEINKSISIISHPCNLYYILKHNCL